MKHINIITATLFALCSLTACDDWTDTESLDIDVPSIEEQNPTLYAEYVAHLLAYKASDHKVVIAFTDNKATTPASRSEHLTSIPDSVDYICLTNPMQVSDAHRAEIAQVHAYGTRVLALVDFDAIATRWKALLDAEEPAEDEARFITYCSEQVSTTLAAIDQIEGLDGIVASYEGYDVNAMQTDEQVTAETSRQAAFVTAITQWKAAHADKTLIMAGKPQNLMDRSWLADCRYIILQGESSKNVYQMNYHAIMASVTGVPTDRFVIGTTTPYQTANGDYNGIFSDGTSAITGAAQWAITPEANFQKSGIAIRHAEQDYYNIQRIYPYIRTALQILSPTVI